MSLTHLCDGDQAIMSRKSPTHGDNTTNTETHFADWQVTFTNDMEKRASINRDLCTVCFREVLIWVPLGLRKDMYMSFTRY